MDSACIGPISGYNKGMKNKFIYCIVSKNEYYFEPYSFWLSEEEAEAEIKRLEKRDYPGIYQELIVKKIEVGAEWAV